MTLPHCWAVSDPITLCWLGPYRSKLVCIKVKSKDAMGKSNKIAALLGKITWLNHEGQTFVWWVISNLCVKSYIQSAAQYIKFGMHYTDIDWVTERRHSHTTKARIDLQFIPQEIHSSICQCTYCCISDDLCSDLLFFFRKVLNRRMSRTSRQTKKVLTRI